MLKILIAGATGYIGRFIIEQLQFAKFYTRVVVREPDKLMAMEMVTPVYGKHKLKNYLGDIKRLEK